MTLFTVGGMMELQFERADVDIYVHKLFRNKSLDQILPKTTHLAVGAHQDDIELMAFHGIQNCYRSKSRWFMGVTLTDGRSSPRSGGFKGLSDNKMAEARKKEQRKAASLGGYLCQIQLGYRSDEIKENTSGVCNDLENLFRMARPKYVYLHNLCDKHLTHVAAAVRCLTALRRLREEWTPEKVFGCEVWRDLDWLPDEEKILHPVSQYPALRTKLVRAFKSQVAGGKRYDLGIEGRRRANATFFESSKTDQETHLNFAMDLTPLVRDLSLDPREFVRKKLDGMKSQVLSSLERFL
jgi:LmbE family N-acetylglucosaminyl deacetylase